MFDMTVHWAELIARALLTYLFLLFLLRITGKRQVGQLAPFDLVLLLVLSNSVQNAMNGGDTSFIAGVVSAVTLVGANWLMGTLTARWKWLEGLVEGRPKILIHDGKVRDDTVAREQITHHELMAALRHSGICSINDVHYAVLE